MPKPAKYYWTRKEEARLLELVKGGITDRGVLAKELNRTPGAISKKLDRMGVVGWIKKTQSKTTSAIISKDLLTHEEALKILAGALELLRKPGHDKLELQRLRILVKAVSMYDAILEKFERWIEIEQRLLEMNKKIEELQKAKTVQS
ncbi:MAG: hypothetical protein GTO14_14550 [Anaerolineales bacterium]|nr:hypothetical protein [Anaerolineales bacterium]